MRLHLRRSVSLPVLVWTVAAGLFAFFSVRPHWEWEGDENEEAEEHEPKFDQPDEAIKWMQIAMRDESGNIPRDGLMNAKRQMDAMRAQQRRAFAGLADNELPSIAGINNGGWTWIGPGNIGGRTRALSVNPGNTNDIVIGGVAGGIWRTFDAGASWNVVNDFMANLAVSCIVRKPNDAGLVLVGTGEGFFNSDSIRGAGVFRSFDAGQSWSQLGSTANSNFDFVNRLTYSPDSSILLAATRTGIWRSTDNGDSWNQQLSLSNGMTDVKFIPGSNTLAVASGQFRRIYYSNDGGVVWTTSFMPATGGTGSSNRIELGMAASAPMTVYASFAAGGSTGTNAEIWKSTNGGVNFALTSTPNHLGTQGWYDNTIWVDPTNVSHVIVGGVSRFRSTDAGATFPGMGGSVHSDHHGFVSDPGYDGGGNRKVYFVNDGGVYRLEDALGATFTRLNNNYGVTQFYGGAGHNASGKIFGGTQDNGTLVYTPAGGPQGWTSTFGGDGGYATFDQTNGNYLYGELQWLGVHRSSNGGSFSSQIIGCGGPAPLVDACNNPQTTNFISPILLDPNDPNLLYGGGQQLWRNNDARNSSNWASVKGPTGGSSSISAIAIKTGSSDIVWVGHNNGDVYMTTNGTSGGPMWIKVDDNGLPNRTATSIAVDPANSDIVYVTFGGFNSGNIWRTVNAGASWSDVSAGLPAAPIRSVAVHPFIAGWVYVGSDVGLFASENSGASWGLPHDGPANVAVFQVFFMNSTIVAVTHGRGMFTASASSSSPTITQHPQNRAVGAGGSTSFTAVATGFPPPSLQWQLWNGAAWVNLSNNATYGGVNTTSLTITAATVGLSGSQYRMAATNTGGTAFSAIGLLTVYGPGVSFVQNPDFTTDAAGWNVFEVPDIVWGVAAGLFQFYKASPTTTPSGQAVVYQYTGVSLAGGTGLSSQFDLGNSSPVRKRITVLLVDWDFSDLHVCTFFLAPNSPMRTYQMRSHTNQPWANASIFFYAASSGFNGGNYLVDNVAVKMDPAASVTRTDCVDPTAPTPPGGEASANLLGNGDFASGTPGPWSIFGNMTWQISSGVFEFYKPNNTPPAGVLTQGGGPMPAGQILTATFKLGNSSATRRRVTVLLNDADFSDLVACTFWLPAGQPLDTYTLRTFTTKAWGNALISFYSATAGAFQWARIDDVTLQTTPASIALGTECIEPVPPAPNPLAKPGGVKRGSGGTAASDYPVASSGGLSFVATTRQKLARYRLMNLWRAASLDVTR